MVAGLPPSLPGSETFTMPHLPPTARIVGGLVLVLLPLLAAAGCGGPVGQARWDGRRGYDGNGDYGYDPDAPRAAVAYQARASQGYPAPGPPDDPWGPHIHEAAARFGVPEAWVRAVMRQESGGRQSGADGAPVTSSAGAMGLMQVMPDTYAALRQRHGLGDDPYEPRSNILAGTAYLREMHARFGAPAFLAAYNAGPDRVEAYLAGSTMLPDETVSYVAAIGPRIGMAGSFGPGGLGQPDVVQEAAAPAQTGSADAAYAGGGMTGTEYAAARR